MENILMVKANNIIPERKLMYFKLSSYEQEQKIVLAALLLNVLLMHTF